MANVSSFLTRTLKLIGVVGEGQTATNEQLDDALYALNDMLAEWNGRGININDGDLILTDDFPVDPEDGRAVRFNLAIEVASEYGRDVRSSVALTAHDTYKAIKARYFTVPEMEVAEALKTDTSFNVITGQ